MILDMFIALLVIVIFLVWLGLVPTKIKVFSIVGLVILFLLGSWIIFYSYTGKDNLGLQYKTGSNITSVGSTTVITYNYSTYNDATTFWVGLLLSITSGIGILLVGAYEE